MNILSIDIGGTAIKYGLVSEDFEILESNEIPTQAQLGGEHLMQKILDIVGEYKDNISCVGISTAGQVDSDEGKIIFANETIPNYTGTEISKTIKEVYNIPASVENDVNSAATAEGIFGSGKGYDDFLCLTYGTGVGGAIWTNGKVYTGANYSAGEFGHIITHVNGRHCNCGGNGCYETYASTTALVRDVEEAYGEKLTGRQIFEPEYFNNEKIKSAIDSWIDEIVAGLTSLIFVFNPSCIVLGGGIMNEDYIINEVSNRVHQNKIHSFKSVEIKKAAMKNKAGMLGAAYLASKKINK